MSRKLKLVVLAQLLTLVFMAQPGVARVSNCGWPGGEAYCEGDVEPAGFFWEWWVDGYVCEESGGMYWWQLAYSASGGAFTASEAEEEMWDAMEECEFAVTN